MDKLSHSLEANTHPGDTDEQNYELVVHLHAHHAYFNKHNVFLL